MSRARVHRHPTRVRKKVFLVTAEIAVLLPLTACLSGEFGRDRIVDFRGAAPPIQDEEEGDPSVPAAAPDEEDATPEEVTDPIAGGEDSPAVDEVGSATTGSDPPGASISGFVSGRFRSRSSDEADDTDLYGVAGVDITTGGADPFEIHLLGRGSWDVDGDQRESTFFGIDDTYDGSVTGRLYEAHVDAPLGDRGIDLARLGRQSILETPTTAYFDGGRVESQAWGVTDLKVGVYGGIPVHQFESSSQGDLIGGLYATFRPWEQGHLRFDWMHLEDETRLGDHDNDFVALGLRHRVGRNLRFEGNFSRLENENRDLALKGLWVLPEQQLTVRFSHYSLLEAQMDLVNELNPFFNALATSFPYDQERFQFSKGFGDRFELFGGLDLRRVDDEADIGTYNRDFDRYYLSTVFLELLPLDTALSLTGEIWDSPGNDISTWGIDFDSKLDEDLRASFGSYYSAFKYYLDIDLERDNVRTYYAEIRKAMSDATDLSARYEFEDEDLDEYHTLRVGVTWRF